MRRRPHGRNHDLLTLAAAVGAITAAATVAIAVAPTDSVPPASAVPNVTHDRLVRAESRGTARTTPPTPQVVVRATHTPAVDSRTGKPESTAGPYADALACIRAHESDTAGGYQAVNPSSGAAGAYQLMPEWSDDWAVRYGHPEWANVTADQWPPAVQDSVAAQLYADNPRAWAGSGC